MQYKQLYNHVRERDIFLKGYMNDCTVSFAYSYIQVRRWSANRPKLVTLEVHACCGCQNTE